MVSLAVMPPTPMTSFWSAGFISVPYSGPSLPIAETKMMPLDVISATCAKASEVVRAVVAAREEERGSSPPHLVHKGLVEKVGPANGEVQHIDAAKQRVIECVQEP